MHQETGAGCAQLEAVAYRGRGCPAACAGGLAACPGPLEAVPGGAARYPTAHRQGSNPVHRSRQSVYVRFVQQQGVAAVGLRLKPCPLWLRRKRLYFERRRLVWPYERPRKRRRRPWRMGCQVGTGCRLLLECLGFEARATLRLLGQVVKGWLLGGVA